MKRCTFKGCISGSMPEDAVISRCAESWAVGETCAGAIALLDVTALFGAAEIDEAIEAVDWDKLDAACSVAMGKAGARVLLRLMRDRANASRFGGASVFCSSYGVDELALIMAHARYFERTGEDILPTVQAWAAAFARFEKLEKTARCSAQSMRVGSAVCEAKLVTAMTTREFYETTLSKFDIVEWLSGTTIRIRVKASQCLWTTIAFMPGLRACYLAFAGDGPCVLVKTHHTESFEEALSFVAWFMGRTTNMVPSLGKFDCSIARGQAIDAFKDWVDPHCDRDWVDDVLNGIDNIDCQTLSEFVDALSELSSQFASDMTTAGCKIAFGCNFGMVTSNEAHFAEVASRTALRLLRKSAP